MPFIKWFKEGVEIKVDGMKYYSEGDELYIQKVSDKDAGTYRCVAENMAGINTAFVKLIVGGIYFSLLICSLLFIVAHCFSLFICSILHCFVIYCL